MIRFLQDYTTTALPPEDFKKDQETSRSDESELYLVKIGVAGFLVDGKLVDQDHRPIEMVEVPVTTVAASTLPGRGGELALGVGAPQRATTGPGNAVMFGGDQQTAALGSQLDALRDQLGNDHAAALAAVHDEHGVTLASVRAQLAAEHGTGLQTLRAQLESEHGASLSNLRSQLTTEHDATLAEVATQRDQADKAAKDADERAAAAEAKAQALQADLTAARASASSGDQQAGRTKSGK